MTRVVSIASSLLLIASRDVRRYHRGAGSRAVALHDAAEHRDGRVPRGRPRARTSISVRSITQAGNIVLGRRHLRPDRTTRTDTGSRPHQRPGRLRRHDRPPLPGVHFPIVGPPTGSPEVYDSSLGANGVLYFAGNFDTVDGHATQRRGDRPRRRARCCPSLRSPPKRQLHPCDAGRDLRGLGKLPVLHAERLPDARVRPAEGVHQRGPARPRHDPGVQRHRGAQQHPGHPVPVRQPHRRQRHSQHQGDRGDQRDDRQPELLGPPRRGEQPHDAGGIAVLRVRAQGGHPQRPRHEQSDDLPGRGWHDYAEAFDFSTGASKWKTDCSGSCQAVQWYQGFIVYGGHFNWTASPGNTQCGDNDAPNTELLLHAQARLDGCQHRQGAAGRLRQPVEPRASAAQLRTGSGPWRSAPTDRRCTSAASSTTRAARGRAIRSRRRASRARSCSVTSRSSGDRPRRRRSVATAGAGSGTVSSNPAGISCGLSCSTTSRRAAPVTLTAMPQGSSTFTGWSPGATVLASARAPCRCRRHAA